MPNPETLNWALRLRLVEEARKLVGVRYELGGRSAKGLDCVGLVALVYQAVFERDPGLGRYPDVPPESLVYSTIGKYAVRIRAEEIMAGDLVLMRWNGLAAHFGIYLGDDRLIHVSRLRRAVIERDAASVLATHGVAYYRIRELAEGGPSSSSSST